MFKNIFTILSERGGKTNNQNRN